ncbi:mastermind-like domain-containing protein 1 isoform X2 [Drosophila busckii]|uniref:mastermind-like domain-containing protein 1 isoform X2 n=1 Tax=Drosophila busckii TaxID=30019 RepID=UPI00083EA49E|nr:mastermind-like domain-containing protein 1 isoform X2 [Drosophila busckii]
MAMDSASLAMDLLRAASEEHDANDDTIMPAAKGASTSQPEYVSQFRIDGQPILPPLMTPEKQRQMQMLRERALQLEAKYKESSTSVSMMPPIPPPPPPAPPLAPQMHSKIQGKSSSSPARNRPQTLAVAPQTLPSICVNPPTPLQEQLLATPTPSVPCSPAPSSSSCNLSNNGCKRKVNNITRRIMQFEVNGLGKQSQVIQPAEVVWQSPNQETATSTSEKRMQRSSTSPSFKDMLPTPAAQPPEPLQRSHSFTLEQPSQALLDHMQRHGNKLPNAPPTAAETTTKTPCSRVVAGSVNSCSSALSLSQLRRDTVESKAKQVQRSRSSSCCASKRTVQASTRLQQQQQQLEQLLQRALNETNSALAEQEQQGMQQLTQAKRKMMQDIKTAHRDRFQQLMQLQHKEQARLQAEFDRQQKYLIEQICAEINVAAYPYEALSPGGVSEYTSTDDLNSTITSSPNLSSVVRKRLFDQDSDATSELLALPLPHSLSSGASTPRTQPLRASNKQNSNSNNNSINSKAPLRSVSARKASSPQTTTARVVSKKTTATQQQQSQRRVSSPSRQTRFVGKKH